MPNSLENSVEDFFVLLFKADPRSAAKNICHHEEEGSAEELAIVIRAVQGAHSLAGPGGYELEVTVEYRAPIGTSEAENDLTSAALHQIVYERTVVNQAALDQFRILAGLDFLLVKDESAGDRQDTQDLRKRSITLPVQAKLA